MLHFRALPWLLLALGLPGCDPDKGDGARDERDPWGNDDTSSGGGDGGEGEGEGETVGGEGEGEESPRMNVTINEFMASNATTIQDDSGAYPDWIELYNAEPTAVSLSGYTITDDLDDPAKHMLGDLTIEAGGFLLLWADNDESQGDLHLSFSLSADGEDIGLYDAAGRALARLSYEPQAADWSAARIPDGSDTWTTTAAPTPGATNGTGGTGDTGATE